MSHCCISSASDAEDIWRLFESIYGFNRIGNPDALELILETFGVEQSRNLYDWSIKKSFSGNIKVAVISANSVTTEAQNALLKLFEEPPARTYFFLNVPNVGMILPTLLSRVQIVSFNNDITETGLEFIQSDISGRFKIVAPIVKSRDRSNARLLIGSVIKHSQDERLLDMEKYISSRSPSVKIILEYLSVLMLKSKHV